MYNAIVSRITNKLPHTKADRLEFVIVCNTNVITQKDLYQVGDLVLFFPSDGQLSEEYTDANDLVARYDENKVRLNTGYMDENRRVKAINLRGEKSDGLVMPISSLQFTNYDLSKLKDGEEFDTLNNIPICNKYFSKATTNSKKDKQSSNLVKKLKTTAIFHEHVDTKQLRLYLNTIPLDSTIVITSKFHGTCMKGDVRVTMKDGTKKYIKDVKEGEYVLGYDHNTNEVVSSLVHRALIWAPVKDWIKIEYKSFYNIGNTIYKIRCTPEHRIFTKNRGYVKAKNLTTEDIVVQSFPDYKISNDHYQILLGKLLGDAYLNKKVRGSIAFGHKVEHESYIDYTLNALGILSGSKLKDYQTSGYGTQMVRVNTKFSASLLSSFGEMYNPKRVITQKIADSIDWIAVAFWYMDDGGLSHTEFQKDRANFACCSYDYESSLLLKGALERLGLDNITLYTDEKGYCRIRVNASSADIMFRNIAPYMTECMSYKLPEEHRHLVKEDYLFADSIEQNFTIDNKVISVESFNVKRGNSRYDLTTETGNFFASSLLVHNSGRQSNTKVTKEFVPFNLHTKLLNLVNKIKPKVKDKKLKDLLDTGLVKVLNRIKYTKTYYDYVLGTRRVVLDKKKESKGYYDTDKFRWDNANKLFPKLHKGEEIYYEIVGYVKDNQMIMPAHDATATKDKEFIKRYGKSIEYTYGCEPGESKIYVYRIAVTNEDGHQWDLTWEQVKARCAELEVEHVPEIAIFYPNHFVNHVNPYESLLEKITEFSNYPNPDGTFSEGVCIRVEKGNTVKFYKEKNWHFKVMEGIIKDDPNIIDIEEAEG